MIDAADETSSYSLITPRSGTSADVRSWGAWVRVDRQGRDGSPLSVVSVPRRGHRSCRACRSRAVISAPWAKNPIHRRPPGEPPGGPAATCAFLGAYTTGTDLQETAIYSAMKVAEALAPASRKLASLRARMRANGIAGISYDL